MPIISLNSTNPAASRSAIATAADELRAGALVAFPTETVYGLGADATNGDALARIFETKGRPRINPLIVHVENLEAARKLVIFNPLAEELAEAFWPGGLTLVLPKAEDCPVHDLASAGLSTLAVRVPDHEVAQALIRSTALPIAAPSANASGEPSPTLAAHVAESLGEALTILDGGPCRAGLESTVVGFEDGRCVLMRSGATPRAAIEAIAGRLTEASDDPSRPASPGRLLRHYAPKTRLRLNAEAPRDGEVFIAFGPSAVAGALQLSANGSTREAAANLFAFLRDADRRGAHAIAVAPVPDDGLGEAVNDRLRRAAGAQQS